jgi:ParB family chromosome partitioning protein
LAALLGTQNEPVPPAAKEGGPVRSYAGDEQGLAPAPLKVHQADEHESEQQLLYLNVYEIDDNPFQPRRDFRTEEIAALAASLKSHQMLQPILVRRVAGRYQLISGERRLRAAIHAGWKTVPAQLREADDRLAAELAIVENLQRKDLNPVEKALSFKRYLDEHGCAQEDLARRLEIDRSTIANLIRLLELPEPVLENLRVDRLSAGHARALLPLGDESLQIEFCQRILNEGWSVRNTEQLVQQWIVREDAASLDVPPPASRKRAKSEQVLALEQQLRMALGTKVEIRQAGRGRGRVIVHFTDHEEFERLMQLLAQQ